MLKLGEKIINQIYLGDKKIAKVFLGDKLVYQSDRPIFLDYVHFDGDCYVDTGIKLQSCTVETAVQYELDSSRRMLSGWVGYNNLYWGMTTTGTFELGGGLLNSTTNLTDYTEIQIVYDVTARTVIPTVDGVTQSFTITPDYSQTYTIGCSIPSSGNKVIGNVYYSTFYNADSVIIQDLRPCIDPQGVVCFYDLVTRKYFYNQGTGTLKAGGRFVSSILFDGASYIDTGISHQTCTVNVDVRFRENGARQLTGFGSSTAQYWGKSANATAFESLTGTNALDRTLVTLDFNTDNTTSVILTRTADGKSSTTTGKNISDMTYKIGALPTTNNVTNGFWCNYEVWSNSFIINGEVIQDLRPYVDENGIACFKDVVTGNLFYNQGTGTLGYTE